MLEAKKRARRHQYTCEGRYKCPHHIKSKLLKVYSAGCSIGFECPEAEQARVVTECGMYHSAFQSPEANSQGHVFCINDWVEWIKSLPKDERHSGQSKRLPTCPVCKHEVGKKFCFRPKRCRLATDERSHLEASRHAWPLGHRENPIVIEDDQITPESSPSLISLNDYDLMRPNGRQPDIVNIEQDSAEGQVIYCVIGTKRVLLACDDFVLANE